MSSDQLPELPDEHILAEVERAIAGQSAQGEPGSMGELCSLLAHAPAQASPQFQHALEQQLMERLAPAPASGRSTARPRLPFVALQRAGSRGTAQPHPSRSPLLRATLAVLIVVLIGFFFPGVRAAASEVIQRLLVGGYVEEPGGPVMFVPTPPFVVKQPAYLPRGMRRVGDRYITGPFASTPQAPATAGPERGATTTPIMPGALWETFSQQRGTAASITLGYEDADGGWLVVFQRALLPDEYLPAGENIKVGPDPAVLQGREGGLKLTWVSEGTWFELEGSPTREEQLRVAEGFRASQRPTAQDRVQPGTADIESVFVEIPLLTAEEAQQRSPFRIPEPGWIPPGFSQVGSSSMGAWARHLYRAPAPEGQDAPSINLQIHWGHDEGSYEYFPTTGEETVQVNGVPAQLILGETTQFYEFSWEADGFSYRLSFSSTGLSRADMLRMAESVRPIEA